MSMETLWKPVRTRAVTNWSNLIISNSSKSRNSKSFSERSLAVSVCSLWRGGSLMKNNIELGKPAKSIILSSARVNNNTFENM